MIDPPKRRGRPPGSKNKPKPPLDKAEVMLAGPGPGDDRWPLKLHEQQLSPLLTEPPTYSIVIVRRRSVGNPGAEVTVDWPLGWPLPEMNDSVETSGVAGIIVYRTFDLRNGRIILTVR